MIARLTWALGAVALALPVGLYGLEHRVSALEDDVVRFEGMLLDEQSQAHVLRAEWAHLNQPRRLQELILRHEAVLGLEPITPAQVARIADLPARLQDEPSLPVPARNPFRPVGLTTVADQ
ncbi:MAG: hypothetical protein RIM84_23285 [Alphaproteobacteria bacterium]